jgi:predicted Zn-dependent peptidase
VLENLKKVTLAEVQKVADKYLSPANEIKIVVKGEE